MTGDHFYIRLASILKRHITEGKYSEGTILPSINRLQNLYGFSRNTTIAALKILSDEKIIERKGTSRQGYRVVDDATLKLNKGIPDTNHNATVLILPFNYWNYVGSKLLESLEPFFSNNNSNLILRNHKNSPLIEGEAIKQISRESSLPIQGVILVTSTSFSNPNINEFREIQARIPLILLDRKIETIDTWYVGVNNHEIGKKQVAHLYAKGHTRIGYFTGFERISTMDDRLKGFLEEMENKGLKIDNKNILLKNSLYENLESFNNVPKLLEQELKIYQNGPTAYVCGSDKDALALYLFLRKRGIRVPEDIAIIGCDEDEFVKTRCGFSFTTFRYPYEELSRETKDLFDQITNHSDMPIKKVEISAKLIHGDST